MSKPLLIAITAVLSAAPALALAQTGAVSPFDTTVRTRILPKEEELLVHLVKDGRQTVIDGVPVFNGQDKFLPGKIALGLTDFLLTLPKDDPRLPAYLADFRQIAAMTVDDANDSWGAYYYVYALNKLRKAGYLGQAVDRLTLAKLRVRLDWRMFVDPDTIELIDHPNNYYVVAFGIARQREQMGWEEGTPSQKIYAKVAEHYRLYSGQNGFADETDGEGRFDRYSVLLAGELCNHFLSTDGQPPAEALAWLRKSANVMLMRIHEDGAGFEYGRSLGPYSETAIIEVLTAAARAGLLNESEKALAYDYASRAASRYVNFWVDAKTGSVNLWDNGRRTDTYRGKFRILGENLSLAHQYAYTNAAWNEMGFKAKPPSASLKDQIDALPAQTVTWFAKGDYDRLLLTVRDQGHIIGLPLINGADGQHMHNPYFPVPYSRGMLEGVADGDAPLLVPQIELKDGAKLMPLAYFRDANIQNMRPGTRLTYRQTELDRLGSSTPQPDDRFSVATTYRFETGRITRTDVFTPKAATEIKAIRMDFATFSRLPQMKGNVTVFGEGAITRFTVKGLDCANRPAQADPAYHSDTGPMQTLVTCTGGAGSVSKPFTVQWTLDFK